MIKLPSLLRARTYPGHAKPNPIDRLMNTRLYILVAEAVIVQICEYLIY